MKSNKKININTLIYYTHICDIFNKNFSCEEFYFIPPEEIYKKTNLDYKQQLKALRDLEKFGVVDIKIKRAGKFYELHYRTNLDNAMRFERGEL